MAGPGGKTLPFGGVVNVSDLPSLETDASMKTSRALEWKAWLEKPKSIRDTVRKGQSRRRIFRPQSNAPWMVVASRSLGMVMGTVNFWPKPSFSGSV